MGKVGAAVRYLTLIKQLSCMHGGRAITAHGKVGMSVEIQSVNENRSARTK